MSAALLRWLDNLKALMRESAVYSVLEPIVLFTWLHGSTSCPESTGVARTDVFFRNSFKHPVEGMSGATINGPLGSCRCQTMDTSYFSSPWTNAWVNRLHAGHFSNPRVHKSLPYCSTHSLMTSPKARIDPDGHNTWPCKLLKNLHKTSSDFSQGSPRKSSTCLPKVPLRGIVSKTSCSRNLQSFWRGFCDLPANANVRASRWLKDVWTNLHDRTTPRPTTQGPVFNETW